MSIFSEYEHGSITKEEFDRLGAEMNRRERIDLEEEYNKDRFQCTCCHDNFSTLYRWVDKNDEYQELCGRCFFNAIEEDEVEPTEIACAECKSESLLYWDPETLRWLCESCMEEAHEIPEEDLIDAYETADWD